ncbi:DNA methylase [Escherichia coli]|nr:DNA methylase [Escherichia coli]
MYCTVKEIIREVLDTDVPDSECVFAVVLTRGDVRHIARDWSLSDDELETVMQRLDDAFVYGACDSPGGDAGKSDGAGR